MEIVSKQFAITDKNLKSKKHRFGNVSVHYDKRFDDWVITQYKKIN